MLKTRRPVLEILDRKFIERILNEAYELLEKVGIMVENEKALHLLAEAGAAVERSRHHARIGQHLVESALKTAPAAVTIFDREGHEALKLKDDHVYFNPGSAALNILDWETQRQRKPVTSDLVNFACLTEALANIRAQSTALIPADVPENITDRYRLYIALRNCSKPIVTGTFTLEGFEVMKNMLVAIRGSAEKLQEKPLAIFDCCPSPPLKWSNLTCQCLIDCAEAGIPAELVSMPLTGGTAPATLAGALVQHTAENLSGIVIHQLARSGAPIIYGGSPAAMDMRTGTTPMGAIETMMLDCAYARIGKHLGLPTHAYMALSDAKLLDAQAGLETGIGAVLAALSGINVISGPGMLDFESCQSLEKLVVDNEICGMALRLLQGIQARTEKLSEELFGEIYAGDYFLTSLQTLRWFREEVYFPSEVIDRDRYQVWSGKGGKPLGERAHTRVQELLSQRKPSILSESIAKELEKIMQIDARKYSVERLPAN